MGVVETTLELTKIAGKIANPELVQEAMKANGEALAISRENLELHKRVIELDDEAKQLKQRIVEMTRFKGIMQRIAGHVFVEGDDEEICPRCAEVDLKLVHLTQSLSLKSGQTSVICPQCRFVGAGLGGNRPWYRQHAELVARNHAAARSSSS